MRNVGWLLCFYGILGTAIGYSQGRSVATPTQGEPAEVSGLVRDGVTGKPLSNVLIRIPQKGRDLGVITDDQGKFVKKDLTPGTWQLDALLPGYIRAHEKQHTLPGSGGITLTLHAGQHLENLEIALMPAAIVTGKVVDSDGRAVAGLWVLPFRDGYNEDGSPTKIIDVSAQTTDDRGQFRFANLDAGKYGFKVEPPSAISSGSPSLAASQRYGTVYYPGVTDPNKAAVIELRSGEEVQLGTIATSIQKTANIHVQLVNESGETAAPMMRFRRYGGEFGGLYTFRAGETMADFGPFLPGDYDLYALGGTTRVVTSFRLSDSDLGLKVTIPKASAIVGGAFVELSDGGLRPIPGVILDFYYDDLSDSILKSTEKTSDSNGQFSNGTLGHLHYQVRTKSIPENLYVLSAKSGNVDILKDGLTVVDPETPIRVILKEKAAKVSGKVIGDDGLSLPGAVVVMLPHDQTAPVGFVRQASDGNGEFDIPCPPGDYDLFAWSELDGNAFLNKEFMSKFNTKGIPVRVTTGSRLSVDLRAFNP